MVFSSVAFLNLFLPIALIIYFVLAKVFRNKRECEKKSVN